MLTPREAAAVAREEILETWGRERQTGKTLADVARMAGIPQGTFAMTVRRARLRGDERAEYIYNGKAGRPPRSAYPTQPDEARS